MISANTHNANHSVPAPSHEAEQNLKNDVQRDAARTREAPSYDAVETVEKDASRANETIDTQLKDAY